MDMDLYHLSWMHFARTIFAKIPEQKWVFCILLWLNMCYVTKQRHACDKQS